MAQPGPSITQQAPAEKENSINVSPIGLVFGSYSVNYERLINGHHGFIVEGDYARLSDDDSEQATFGGNLGYRYHWSGGQDSGFVGLNVGYGQGTGEASTTTNDVTKTYDVDSSVTRVTANVGRRWAWNSGFNITLRVGAGYGDYNITTDSDDPEAQQAAKDIDDLLTVFPVAIDGELSIGWAF
jgi:hypothetical protein